MNSYYQPLAFNHLPKLSRDEVAFANGIQHWPKIIEEELIAAIKGLVKKNLSLTLLSVRKAETRDLSYSNQSPSSLFVTMQSAQGEKAFFELENSFVKKLIYYSLGTQAANESLSLSELEKGIFSYALLKVLHALKKILPENIGLLSLFSISNNSADIIAYLSNSFYYKLDYRCSYDGNGAALSLFLPECSASTAQKLQKARAQDENKWPLERLAGVLIPISVELYALKIDRQQLLDLEKDDVIVLSNAGLTQNEKILSGEVCAKINNRQAFTAWLIVDENGFYSVQVRKLFEQGLGMQQEAHFELEEEYTKTTIAALPQALINAQNNQAVASLENMSARELLNKLPLSISIELARLNMDVATIMQLKNGQSLELGRKVGDLVDMVVAGKKIGQGELVNIDGELGLRITSLIG